MLFSSNSNIPDRENEFSLWEINFVQLVVLKVAIWGIASEAVSALQEAQTAWQNAWNFAKIKSTRTPVQTKTKNDARETYVAVLRPFIQQWIMVNPLISDEERMALGIKPRETGASPIPAPVATPLVDIQSGVNRSIVINFRTESDVPGKLKRGKPAGCAKVTVAFVINPAQKPATPKDCNQFVSTGKTSWRIEHDPENSGKKAYFFCCYESPRGEKGPWSEAFSFQIP